MIFPGMDPYLEEPRIWPGVHHRLIVYIADRLQTILGDRYIASVEERVFVEAPEPRSLIPDVSLYRNLDAPVSATLEPDAPVVAQIDLEIHEGYLEILDREDGFRVVTVIEVVSPTNKFAGPGRESYLSKQKEVRQSRTHLVEVDLLRAGPHILAVPEWFVSGRGQHDYLISINRAVGRRDKFEFYPLQLRDRLPKFAVPLTGEDPDAVLDLQDIVSDIYAAGHYFARLPYDQPCRPPLTPEDQEWANQLIKAARPQS